MEIIAYLVGIRVYVITAIFLIKNYDNIHLCLNAYMKFHDRNLG